MARPSPVIDRPAAAAPPSGGLLSAGLLPGYQPEPYDPDAADTFGRLNLAFPPGQLGTVYPTRRTGRGVWLTLLLIVALAAGFVLWRLHRSGPDAPAATGVDYRSPAGHFSAHFAARPVEVSWTTGVGRARATYRGASVADDATMIVETDIARPLPRDLRNELGQFAAGFESSGEFTVTHVKELRFRGHPAREGSYLTPSGQLDTVLIVAHSVRQIYVLMAPTGGPFETLRDSFAVHR